MLTAFFPKANLSIKSFFFGRASVKIPNAKESKDKLKVGSGKGGTLNSEEETSSPEKEWYSKSQSRQKQQFPKWIRKIENLR